MSELAIVCAILCCAFVYDGHHIMSREKRWARLWALSFFTAALTLGILGAFP
jgi:hypothetical protein